MHIVLIAPTALDMAGRPVKQRRGYFPGLTLQMLIGLDSTPAPNGTSDPLAL